MAITRSAEKALRQSIRRKAKNLKYKNQIKNLLKEARVLLQGQKIKEAQQLLPQIYKALDKAAKKGVIKKNTAARKKSRLTKKLAVAK